MGGLTLDNRLRADDLFESLGSEEERERDREIEVKGNHRMNRLEILTKKFEEFDNSISDINNTNAERILGTVKEEFSSRDINEFLLFSIKYCDEKNFSIKLGIYLSALINMSKDSEFYLSTRHLPVKPRWIGNWNRKKITIDGDVGNGLGAFMTKGKITLNGNADNSVGFYTSRGEIYVSGNAGDDLGNGFKGEQIRVDGDFKLSEFIIGGNIYHKDKLIIKDGTKSYWYFYEKTLNYLRRKLI